MSARNLQKTGDDSDATMRITDVLRPAIHRLGRRLRREAASAGMSTVDLYVLGTIKLRPGIGVSELAELEHITRPTMSSHVKRLREKGWVIVGDDTGGDQRRSSVTITDEGLGALDKVKSRSNDWLTKKIGELAPEQIEALTAAISAIADLGRR
jgi:DNA-binding MarR family transcriptional regulator